MTEYNDGSLSEYEADRLDFYNWAEGYLSSEEVCEEGQ